MELPRIDMKATGERIRQARHHAGLTVAELQDAMGFLNPDTIYKWQCGRSLPKIDNFVILAYLFGTTIDDLIVIE